ncbi:MAG: DUF1572 family protein [Acidobacteria bacterium]|nr:DUF1572 family protein [Acidobacteriota bacterium]MBI3425080.1 DUF1572 family protein [Acidobacteriota bacterium]
MTKESPKLYSLEPPAAPLPAALAFLRQARFRLREDYPVKLRLALAPMNEEQIWWRPNNASNSIGNLLLHLCGNARQWIVAGVGDTADVRTRAAEFAAQGALDKEALLTLLEATLTEVDGVLCSLESEVSAKASDAPLQRLIVPQGFPQTVLDAIFHVVEHFSYHTGQIVYLTKQVSEQPTRFYDERALNQE